MQQYDNGDFLQLIYKQRIIESKMSILDKIQVIYPYFIEKFDHTNLEMKKN